jgi:hypothetical protein
MGVIPDIQKGSRGALSKKCAYNPTNLTYSNSRHIPQELEAHTKASVWLVVSSSDGSVAWCTEAGTDVPPR